jgi:hypothetical protein
MTNPTTLLALAERCEQAAGPDQKAAMLAVVDALGLPSDQHYRAVRMIEIGAYESAAITLVPEGWFWEVRDDGVAWVTRPDGGMPGTAAAPALALGAAALRARAAMG